VTIAAALMEQVRTRAGFAYEYCGVTETDAGGLLTVDHCRPKVRGGTDALDNLLYCCYRCNLYKADYWPEQPTGPRLWDPRQEPRSVHFLTLLDGTLYAITAVGQITLRRLRLNRPALVAYRLRARERNEPEHLLERYRDLVTSLEQLYEQQVGLLAENRSLLEEQRAWLRALQGPRDASTG
jgi:hypothetical protein